MRRTVQLAFIAMCPLLAWAPARAADTVADGVLGYVQGVVVADDANYLHPTVALGGINGYTGIWGGGLNPFNSAWQVSDIVVIGEGGSLTLHLSKPVPTNGRTLGVYGSIGYIDMTADGSGLTDGGPSIFSDPSGAVVSVSQDGITWTKLNGGLPIDFNMPTNYYTDTPISYWYQAEGNQVASQSKPFLGTPSDLANQTYDQIKTTLNNSCGGNWLDLSGTGLPAISYVRFDVPAGARMAVDAIGATGAAAPVAPGGRIVSESVGAGANTSHIVIDFGPRSYQFDVQYDGNLTGFAALQMLAGSADFAMAWELHGSYGNFITSMDYGGYVQTGDGFGGTSYWAYYTGDGNTWNYSGKGASTRNLSNGSYDGWIWTASPGVYPDFPVAPGTECIVSAGNWSDGGTWRASGPLAGTITNVSNGGTVAVDQGGLAGGILTVGWSAGQSGAVHMLAGGALQSDRVYVGYGGAGAFVQSGGGHRVDGNLCLGLLGGSGGSYHLSDGNLWVAGSVYVGCDGNGAFSQTGGRHTIGERLYVGQNPDGNGTYSLTGGELVAPHISVGAAGTLELGGGALSGSLLDANLLTGVDIAGLVHITAGEYWLAYVYSSDPGALLGTLEVDEGATLHVGEIRVDSLIGAGTIVLDTSMIAQAAPPQSIGDLGTIPEPATLAMVALGGLAIARRRRAVRKR